MSRVPIGAYEKAEALISYCSETGSMVWAKRNDILRDNGWNIRLAGKECGHIRPDGYREITIRFDGKACKMLAHRLAWFIANGILPEGQIDHINQDRRDNRICNLRDVTVGLNAKNQRMPKSNTSGVMGVWWNKSQGKWQAKVQLNGKAHHVGLFDDLSEAESAVTEFRHKLGFTAQHGTKSIEREGGGEHGT